MLYSIVCAILKTPQYTKYRYIFSVTCSSFLLNPLTKMELNLVKMYKTSSHVTIIYSFFSGEDTKKVFMKGPIYKNTFYKVLKNSTILYIREFKFLCNNN
jgi:hypothetical protein